MDSSMVILRYDGPALKMHRMDAADIAPVLLGISDLCKLANTKFYGDRGTVKVLIGTDTEHNCFQLGLYVFQFWEHTKLFLENDNVRSAKELFEWIGLAAASKPALLGFLPLLRKIGGRKISSETRSIEDGRLVARVTIEGDNDTVILAHPQATELLRDQNALENAEQIVEPLTREGYDSVEFESQGRVTERIGREDAVAISRARSSGIAVLGRLDKSQTVTAWITVYSPVYDVKAPKWRFRFGKAREYMDISETDIAAQAIKHGGAMIDDAYKVELEITQEHTLVGGVMNRITNHYKVKRVLEFKPAQRRSAN